MRVAGTFFAGGGITIGGSVGTTAAPLERPCTGGTGAA